MPYLVYSITEAWGDTTAELCEFTMQPDEDIRTAGEAYARSIKVNCLGVYTNRPLAQARVDSLNENFTASDFINEFGVDPNNFDID